MPISVMIRPNEPEKIRRSPGTKWQLHSDISHQIGPQREIFKMPEAT